MSLDSLMLSPSLRDLLDRATAQYEQNVHLAASYLASRGIDQDAATGHRLGVACEPLPSHEKFRDWLCIPFVTPAGVVAMKFRCIADHDCKAENCQRYDSPSGQKARLYGAQGLSTGGEVAVVVEGELSALIAQSALSVAAAGTPGTTWLDHWPRCFADFDRVIVVADHDVREDKSSPGLKHAEKVRKTIEGAELVVPPPGLDFDEWLTRDGVDEVKKAMNI